MPGRRLILNADDFVLTGGINRAIAELYRAGALTSATLMASGPAFEDAVATARSNPGLSIGCHVVLTDGTPVSEPKDIPTLLGPDGRHFRSSLLSFLFAVISGRVREEEIARETFAQVQRLQQAGLDVTHLDTHKHTHILPRVARALLQVAEQTGVPAVRNPFEHSWSLAVSRSSLVRRLQVRLMAHLRKSFEALPQICSGAVVTSDGTIGISATGHLDQACLESLLTAMPEGTWELVCHPGYNDSDLDQVATRLRETREIEREALLSLFGPGKHDQQLPRSQFIQLTQYGGIVSSAPPAVTDSIQSGTTNASPTVLTR